MSILTTLGRFANDYRVARDRARTERIIRSLPAEIQKDIGWPGVLAEGATRRHPVVYRAPHCS